MERDQIFRLFHMNAIPKFRTTAIVKVPYGAHSSSCLQVDYDRGHMKMYAGAARDPAGYLEYTDKYVYDVGATWVV